MCFDGAIGVFGAILAPAIQATGRPGVNALVGWIQAVAIAVTMVAVGVVYSRSSAQTQVLAIALAFLVVRLVFLTGMSVLAFRVILRIPMAPVLRPTVPAVFAAVAAAGLGWSVQMALGDVNPPLGLVLTGMAATVVAGLVLYVFDPEVHAVARRLMQWATALVRATP